VAESARSIAKLGREVYDRLGVFSKHFSKVGPLARQTAVGAYNEAVGSLETRVLVTARKFPEHGISGGGAEATSSPRVAPIERQTRPFVAAELTGGEPVRELPARAVDAA